MSHVLRMVLLAAAVVCIAAALADGLWMEGIAGRRWRQARRARGDKPYPGAFDLLEASTVDSDPQVDSLRRRFVQGVMLWNGLLILAVLCLAIRSDL